jgi:hypothetical protein
MKLILSVNMAICASVLPVLVAEPPKVLKISFFLSAVNCMAISNGRQRYKTKMSKCGYSCEKV